MYEERSSLGHLNCSIARSIVFSHARRSDTKKTKIKKKQGSLLLLLRSSTRGVQKVQNGKHVLVFGERTVRTRGAVSEAFSVLTRKAQPTTSTKGQRAEAAALRRRKRKREQRRRQRSGNWMHSHDFAATFGRLETGRSHCLPRVNSRGNVMAGEGLVSCVAPCSARRKR